MRKIAITGIIGAGKSTVGSILQNLGMDFISADALVRQALVPNSPVYLKLLNLLGPEYLDPKNYFNFQKIAKKAFRDKNLLVQMEAIIHPVVWSLMKKEEEKQLFLGKTSLFYEIPLLFEKNLEDFFDTKIVIAISPEEQESRLLQYRKLSSKDIKSRMLFQMPQDQKIAKADHVIWNNSSVEELKKQVFSLVNLLKIKKNR